jgi:hypothetical protein
MPTGYDMQMYRNLDRIAKSLERIANALEQQTYGVTGRDVAEARRLLAEGQGRIGRVSGSSETPSGDAA